MKPKTLIVTAILAAGGVAGAQAQDAGVLSQNAVGYVQLEIGTGFNLIANTFDAESNVVEDLFADVPAGTEFFKFTDGAVSTANKANIPGVGDIWSGALAQDTLMPGEGIWVRNPGEPFTQTFVGEVMQGTLTTELPEGFTIASSQVPQEGALVTDLSFPADSGISVFQFDGAGFSANTLANIPGVGDIWSGGAEPSVTVGEAFWVEAPAGGSTWTREFDVNAQ